MDMISYALGAKDGEKKGKQTIALAGDYTFTDTGEGNIVITKVSSDTPEKGE